MLEQDYIRPESLEDAVNLLYQYGSEAKVLAGGTDLIIGVRENIIKCKVFIDIKKIHEMNEIYYSEQEGLSIGGAVSLNDIMKNEIVREQYSILYDSAKTLANSLLRNRATLIGNICNASPAGDMLPAALVLGGYIETVSREGKHLIPLKEFFKGVKKNALREDEIALRVVFPPILGNGHYIKKSRIKGHDLSQICEAGFLKNDGTLSIAIGSVYITPVLLENIGVYSKEQLLDIDIEEEIVSKVIENIHPISDQRASKEYRIAMAAYLTRQIIQKLAKEV